MRENKLRKLLQKGKPTIGTHIHSTWPGVLEIIGKTEMVDYVEFLGEYSNFNLEWFDTMARITELYDISSMLKVDQGWKTFMAQRAVGSGIQSILFTDIRSIDDAKECIKIVRAETPETGGILGCAMRRDVGYLYECGSKEFVNASNDTVVAFMIEKKEAVEQIEEILSLDGLDMVQFGPCDYSMSIGLPGEMNHPKVKEAEFKVIEKALEKGIVPRVELFNVEDAEKYLELGVRHFCIGYDIVILNNWIIKNVSKLKELL